MEPPKDNDSIFWLFWTLTFVTEARKAIYASVSCERNGDLFPAVFLYLL